MSLHDERRMKANYPGVCRDCKKEISVGDVILWSQQLGARHETCTTNDVPPENQLVVDEDTKLYKVAAMSYNDARKQTVCARCETKLNEDGDKFIRASGLNEGFWRLCKRCFNQ